MINLQQAHTLGRMTLKLNTQKLLREPLYFDAEKTSGPKKGIFSLTIRIHLYKFILIMSLDAAFSAVADPTRRGILARLAQGEATVTELAEPFRMTQPAISQHLKVLEDAGLIVSRIEGTKRPRRLSKAGLDAMDQWLAMLRKALEKNYERLDEVLAAIQPQRKIKETR